MNSEVVRSATADAVAAALLLAAGLVLKVHSTPGSAGEQGLGLGLTLSREHLQRMGGRLALRTLPEGGSEAVIELRSA